MTWQTPERLLTFKLKRLAIDDVLTFGSWIIKRASTQVYHVYVRGVCQCIETFNDGKASTINDIVNFVFNTIVQLPLFDDGEPVVTRIMQVVKRVVTQVLQIVRRVTKRRTRVLPGQLPLPFMNEDMSAPEAA